MAETKTAPKMAKSAGSGSCGTFFLLVCFILLLTAQATKDDDNQTNAVTGCSASFLLTCRPGPHCFATQHQHPAASRLNARCNATRAIRPCEPRTAGRRLFATGVAAAAAQRSKHAFRLRHPFILPRLAAQPKKCNARYPCDTWAKFPCEVYVQKKGRDAHMRRRVQRWKDPITETVEPRAATVEKSFKKS